MATEIDFTALVQELPQIFDEHLEEDGEYEVSMYKVLYEAADSSFVATLDIELPAGLDDEDVFDYAFDELETELLMTPESDVEKSETRECFSEGEDYPDTLSYSIHYEDAVFFVDGIGYDASLPHDEIFKRFVFPAFKEHFRNGHFVLISEEDC